MKQKTAMKMPELWVFGRFVLLGFLVFELAKVSYLLGLNFASVLRHWDLAFVAALIVPALAICIIYAIKRKAISAAKRLAGSHRIDLVIAFVCGVVANILSLDSSLPFYGIVKGSSPYWAPVVVFLLTTLLLSALIQQYSVRERSPVKQMYFLTDDEIVDDGDDLLATSTHARAFAEMVLASEGRGGLIFGIDGPWGIGKTSFLNLASQYWRQSTNKVIVCRFEPLRYASEPDLTGRLIDELSAVIQHEVFAPEFRPIASRYTRLVKGKADFSFLGFKISLEPSQDTVDDLLGDIDEVLKRINRRLIVVIDDLDRLDPKAINNILFAARRTFNLSQATYILCYDTEVLAANGTEGTLAREFLEKFVMIKHSLFIDSSHVRDFLKRNWQKPENQLGSIPSDTMFALASVLSEMATILDGSEASRYLSLLGDFRKVKRVVNAMLLMRLDKSDLALMDIN